MADDALGDTATGRVSRAVVRAATDPDLEVTGGDILGGLALALASVADFCHEDPAATMLRLRAAMEMVAMARAAGLPANKESH